LRIFALPGLDEEEGNRADRIRLLSPLRVFLPIKDQLTVRLEGCDQHYAMLQRNLLYTGQTRGKRLVVLVGHRRLLNQGMILIGPCAPSL